jgi:hypothetical protein
MGSHFFGDAFGNVGTSLSHPWSMGDAGHTLGIGVGSTGANGAKTPMPYYSGVAPSLASAANGYGTNNLAVGQTSTGAPPAAGNPSALGNMIAGPNLNTGNVGGRY